MLEHFHKYPVFVPGINRIVLNLADFPEFSAMRYCRKSFANSK